MADFESTIIKQDGNVVIDTGDIASQSTVDTGTNDTQFITSLKLKNTTSLSNFQKTSEKGAANGYAGLDGSSKINPSQLPSIAITDTFVVASQAAMLALVAQTGDVAVRTDTEETYILQGTDPSVLGDWVKLETPTDAVSSVFGRTGVVTAQSGDYTTAQLTVSTDKNFVTDSDLTNLGNLSGTNTGDQTSIVGITGTVAQFNTAITDATLSGNNTGDQTSIVGITGTTAQFNTALTDADFATGGGTASGTNTGDQTSIVGITGTTAQFNTALTDGSFATGGGTATGTNTGDQTSIVGITGTIAQFNTAITDGDMATGGGTATGTNTGDQTITLTGDVTGSGTGSFATTIAAKAVDVAMLADGTDGELITWDATGVATTVATGTSGHVLTSNGAGAAPTFQAAASSGGNGIYIDATRDNGNPQSVTSGTYMTQNSFILEGATETISSVKARLYLTGGATSAEMRLYDVTNAQEICVATTTSTSTTNIATAGAISNLPSGDAIIQIQVKRTGGAGSAEFVGVKVDM